MFSRTIRTTKGLCFLNGRCHPPLAANTSITPRYWKSEEDGKEAETPPAKLPLLLFCHATGFCKDVWKPVTDELAQYAIAPFRWAALDFSGHGRSRSFPSAKNWEFTRHDVLELIDEVGENSDIVGVGHSMGATALILSALQRPNALRRMVLFEPIVPPPSAAAISDAGGDPFPQLRDQALRRQRTWPSLDAARAYFNSRRAFSSFDPRSLEAYISCGTRLANTDGSSEDVELCCAPEVESSVYSGAPCHLYEQLGQVTVPGDVICGAESEFGPEHFRNVARQLGAAAAGQQQQSECGSGSKPRWQWGYDQMAGCGHLLVLEKPAAAAAAIARGAHAALPNCFRLPAAAANACG